MHTPRGPLLGGRPGSRGEAGWQCCGPGCPEATRPGRSQQLLLVVLGAGGALAHLFVPLVGEGFHLDAPVVEVLGWETQQALVSGLAQGQG